MQEKKNATPAGSRGPRQGESTARFTTDDTNTVGHNRLSALLTPSHPALWGCIGVACNLAAVVLTVGGAR